MKLASALLVALLVIAAPACGGNDETERARDLYRAYRSAEDERGDAEARLRQAFVDIAAAAEKRDRTSSLAAVARGRDAVADIEHLLRREVEAAGGLGAFEDLARDAARLRHGLETTRESLRLFSQEFDIAARDPFLTERANAAEIRTLARRAAQLAVEGEFEIRRADRAIALALDLEPQFDPVVGAETS